MSSEIIWEYLTERERGGETWKKGGTRHLLARIGKICRDFFFFFFSACYFFCLFKESGLAEKYQGIDAFGFLTSRKDG